jgi:hypothetical protein
MKKKYVKPETLSLDSAIPVSGSCASGLGEFTLGQCKSGGVAARFCQGGSDVRPQVLCGDGSGAAGGCGTGFVAG